MNTPSASWDFTDRVVVVTGAARGIGNTIARRFVGSGARVVALDVPSRELETLEVDETTGVAAAIACDVTRRSEVDAAIERIVEDFGRIDVLINNAGINVEGLVEDLDDHAWERCFDVNVTGVLRVCRAVIPVMKRQSSGRIINAASFAAKIPSVGSAAYSASKAAVVQLSRVLAGELGPWNITVNSYAPGMVPTAMNGFADMPETARERLLDTLTLRRWQTADDVANLVLFLASDAASYITGTLVDVSGGKFATQIPARAYAEPID